MEALLGAPYACGAARKGYQQILPGHGAAVRVRDGSPSPRCGNEVGAFLYEHGEAVYRFQGLRAFKEKFNPTWEPRFLAYQGALSLPRTLADLSALIAGGYGRFFLK